MKRILLLSFAFLTVVAFSAMAQRTVSGKVTDDSGESLPGVNVVIKGTTTGTTTDLDGNYRLSVDEGATLVFSFVGFETQEVQVGARSTIDISMGGATELQEVVVTALGFQEDRNKIASSSSQVGGADIKKSGEPGVIQSLAGKASGVRITKNSGDPGSGAYIQIRGQSSITRSLQPLIVIDGVPMTNSEIGNNTGGVHQQSRLNDLNPNDIESVQILKGASASALWGSRGSNGVIVVTTKKGKKGQVQVQYTGTYSVDKISYKHDLQTKYGKGSGGNAATGTSTTGNSWGDKIEDRAGGADEVDTSGQYFEAEDGSLYYPIITKNDNSNYEESNFNSVFQNGNYFENNISLSGGGDNGTFYLSFSDMNQEGIIRNNSDYRRTTGRLNSTMQFNDMVTASTKVTYSSITSNRIQTGSNTSGLYLGFLRTPADFDQRDYKGTYYNAAGVPSFNRQRSYRRQIGNSASPIYDNPLWVINEFTNTSEVDRIIGSFQVDVKPTDWLTLIARVGADHYSDRRLTVFPINSAANGGNGSATDNVITETQTNADFMARIATNLSDDLTGSFIVGMNLNQRQFLSMGGTYQTFILNTEAVTFANATDNNTFPFTGESKVRTSAGYLNANFGYDDTYFLNLTARAENSSAFGDASKIFVYPSAELGVLFSNLIDVPVISNGKFRATYGQVGLAPAAYTADNYYASAAFGESWGPGASASAYDGSFIRDNTRGNEAVEPEKKTEFEVGVDLGFVEDRFNLSATYYQNKVEGALFFVQTAASTGFTNQYDNAATLENNGIELDFSANVIRTGDFNFTVGGNWSKYENTVTDLSGTESLFLAGFTGTSSRAVLGQAVGTLWGGRWDRDADGNLTEGPVSGFPQQALDEGILGDPNPDWMAGLNSTVSYKGFSLFVLVETKQGGDMWDGTDGALHTFGRALQTANETTVSAADAATITNYAGNPITAFGTDNGDGTYTFRGNLEDFGFGTVALDEAWYSSLGGGFGPVGEQFVKDGSWTRLREVTLAYNFPSSIASKLKMNNLRVAATGRNLKIWSKEYFGVDPESNLTGSSNGRGLLYFNNPGTQSYVFTLTATF
ncbi:SusC/RagA family TonB-linked outer membrane protein [Ekhidna sp.]|uniref:SusC/RagA family TonB-linked outer membrane protein n=1 Tax=Ekhidna sp. TaxID=2608089 RepID=UPI003519C446